MNLYTVVPLKGVVEPIDPKTFKKIYPQITEPLSNGYLITNKPYTERGIKALQDAGWIEQNGTFVPPMEQYDQQKEKKSKKKSKKSKNN